MATASGNSLTADHLLYKTAINSQTMAAVCSSSLANFSNFPEGKIPCQRAQLKVKRRNTQRVHKLALNEF